jgi:threonine dehydrogenase-like Zn-dependent dehydrogenase
MWTQQLVAPFEFEEREVPKPRETDLGSGQVLLRTLVGGLCGSDAPFYRGAPNTWTSGGVRPPGFPMHEIVGEVLASRSPHHRPGNQVVGWATGLNGYQEMIVSDGESLHAYDAVLDPAEAIVIQPLACVLYAVERLGPVDGLSCAVIGQGPIGVLFSHVLASRGAGRVTGVDRLDRRTLVRRFGVDDPVHETSESWSRSLGDDLPEVVVEAVGHQVGTLDDAVRAAAVGGRILYFGIPDDPVYPFAMETFLRKHLTLTACSTLERRRMLAEAESYLAAHPGLARALVTDRFDARDANEAYAAAFSPRPAQLKVVVTMCTS